MNPPRTRKPDWLRTAMPSGDVFEATNERLRAYGINTVCSSARCPNLAECWGRGTTTFMILGDTCTRHCRFCAVKTGNPHGVLDETEPERVALAVAELKLLYVVLTSVDRDDLPDLGAGMFVRTLHALRNTYDAGSDAASSVGRQASGIRRPLVEVLTPDFGGREELLRQVVEAAPDVFGHNLETVERLSPQVRDPRASYRRSLYVLATVKRIAPKLTTKSGLMVGLGETDDELRQALRDLRSSGCDIVTVGQYLQPVRRCLPVERYVRPEEFVALEKEALALGFKGALCGPLVRSSFHAAELAACQQKSRPPIA
ncbi:lipoyl synthase [candidate division WOR-3 bacterium]|nr:lipoyl synthase [candidate division WOR-3 bacterium]